MPRVVITVPGKNSQPYRFSLDRKVVKIGRAEDNDIVIESPSVSSHHCEMHRVDGGYTLNDKDSTNGIKLEGTRMEIIDLENHSDIMVGDADLEFELDKEELEELSKEDHEDHERVKLPPLKKEDGDKAAPAVKDVAPAPSAIPLPARQPIAVPQQSSGANFAITIALLALAILTFYLGMATRHRNVTKDAEHPNGRSLSDDLFGGGAESGE